MATVGLSEHAKGGGRGPAPEGGWPFWGSSAIKRKPFEHGLQALPVDPAGGRPVTGAREGPARSEDPGRTWRPVTSPEQVWEEQVVVFRGLAYPPRSPWLSTARGRGVGSSHVQEQGSETPAPGHLARPAGRLLFIGLRGLTLLNEACLCPVLGRRAHLIATRVNWMHILQKIIVLKGKALSQTGQR